MIFYTLLFAVSVNHQVSAVQIPNFTSEAACMNAGIMLVRKAENDSPPVPARFACVKLTKV
jgi:hypothetical protein